MKFSTCTIASFGATMRKYATAFTRTGTLSFVITSCGGMFSVIVRRSTFTIRSTIGNEQEEARALRLRQQPAEPEDDAALVLARDLDRRDQEQDDEEEDDDERDEDGGHRREPTRTVSSRPVDRLDPNVLAGDELARRRRGAPARARPRRSTWPGVRTTAVGADDAVRPDRRRPPPHLHRLRRARTPRRAPSAIVIERTSGTEVWYGAGALWKSISIPTARLIRPVTRQRAVR